jgi:hypothetical protein
MFASFENFSNADFGGNSQSGRNTNRAAVQRNDSAVVPCAVAVPEKVIAWLYLEDPLIAAEVAKRAPGSAAHSMILLAQQLLSLLHYVGQCQLMVEHRFSSVSSSYSGKESRDIFATAFDHIIPSFRSRSAHLFKGGVGKRVYDRCVAFDVAMDFQLERAQGLTR